MVCWGLTVNNATSPPSETFIQVGASKHTFSINKHICGIKTDGNVICWGSDTYGQASPPDNLVALTTAFPEDENTDVTGHTISGTLSLPEGDIAPAGGININLQISTDETDQYAVVESHIPENQSSTSFTLLIPDNSSTKWRLRIHCNDREWDENLGKEVRNDKCSGYVTQLWYTLSGMRQYGWTDDTLFLGGQNYPNTNLVLLRSIQISGTISLPQGKVAPAGGLEILISAYEPVDNGDHSYESVTISEGESTIPYTLTVIDNPQTEWAIDYYGDGSFEDKGYKPWGATCYVISNS
jgi:hypothetical protein